jgi:hypothetical protein
MPAASKSVDAWVPVVVEAVTRKLVVEVRGTIVNVRSPVPRVSVFGLVEVTPASVSLLVTSTSGMLLLVATRLNWLSTWRTVTLKATPAVWAVGVPVLPVRLPGTAVSPCRMTCSCVALAGRTVKAPEIGDTDGVQVMVPSRMLASTAVAVWLTPAVRKVRLRASSPVVIWSEVGSVS